MKIKIVQRGFTLIELMIVVAIVAILASIAYPSYKEYMVKARRAEAKTILLGAQQWMERFYTENFRYDENSAGVKVTDSSQFPSRFSVSPTPGEGIPVYDIKVVVTSGVRDIYSITATPKIGTIMYNDRCGIFSIDYLGRKDLTNHKFVSRAAAMESCWK